MTLVASVLQVGPQLRKVYDYDIVTTQKKAFFALEKCELICL